MLLNALIKIGASYAVNNSPKQHRARWGEVYIEDYPKDDGDKALDQEKPSASMRTNLNGLFIC